MKRGCVVGDVWTLAEDKKLVELAGSVTYEYLLKSFPRRTLEALRTRAKRLNISISQGTWTLNRLVRETGYNWKQLLRAKEAIGQRWARTRSGRSLKSRRREDGRGGRKYLISDDQAIDIMEYLKDEPYKFISTYGSPRLTWATHYSRCEACGTDGSKPAQRHYGKGLCHSCAKKLLRERLFEFGLEVGNDEPKTAGENPESPDASGRTLESLGSGLLDRVSRERAEGRGRWFRSPVEGHGDGAGGGTPTSFGSSSDVREPAAGIVSSRCLQGVALDAGF